MFVYVHVFIFLSLLWCVLVTFIFTNIYKKKIKKKRLGNVDGSLENAYQETVFNPARYCAYMESLECMNNVVEVLCENIVLFTEFVYYTEFF